MDFTKQTKLTKEEWANIEVPCSEGEKRILHLIADGFADVNLSRNYTLSLAQQMKLTNPVQFDDYIYKTYLQETLVKLCKKYGQRPPVETSGKSKLVLKKADLIRMENTTKRLDEVKASIFEFLLLELLENMLKKSSNML